MIRDIVTLLNSAEWLISDEDIDIAKGKYHSPTTFEELKKFVKRNIKRNG